MSESVSIRLVFGLDGGGAGEHTVRVVEDAVP
jgi:hypothetical protein